MFKQIFIFLQRLIFRLGILVISGIILTRLATTIHSMNRIYEAEDAPARPVAIVFGAGLRRDGTPTPILQDRVQTASRLYFDGKVDKILMSGDNSYLDYNEPESMRQYAISLGVPEEAIALDYAGRRTYDTCFRAKAIFAVDEALLVTQKFHLPRALFLCYSLGLDAIGVDATSTRRSWRFSTLIWNTRELFATVGAFLDVYITSPQPALGEPLPLFVD